MVARSLVDALSNFDANEVITKALAASAPKIVALAAEQARKTPDRVSRALGLGFSHHLQTTFDKCYKIKTLIYRDEPVDLLSQYVSIKLGLKRSKLTDNYIIENLESYKNIIVQGTGGSGKTMFMKYLSLCRFENPRGRIPIFVELRTLNYDSGKSIEQLIFEDSASRKSKITFESFEKALTAGIFLIILDGLDEVDPDHRDIIHRQINKIPQKYPDNLLVISSREDPSLDGWNQFYNFNVLPLDKKQVVAVIKKIDFDRVIKTKFLKELSSSLYVKHRSFLTNPLLATIMLLRYDQFANSGDKIHIFYDQAFETLFFKHDLSKGVYERKRYTNISVDDFKRFFAAFCFSSYASNKYAFSRSEIIAYIEKALRYCSIAASPSLVLKDLFESVCIIQEDGLLFTFVHRSFQEYFSALFVSEYRGNKSIEYVTAIMTRDRSEAAGVLLKEMSYVLVTRTWALPEFEFIVGEVKKWDIVNNPAEPLQKICGRVMVESNGLVQGFGVEALGNRMLNLGRYYGVALSSWLSSNLFFNSREDMLAVRELLSIEDKKRFKDRFSPPENGDQDRFVKIDVSDNYWMRHSRAEKILEEIRNAAIAGHDKLREEVMKFDAADEGLI